MGSVGRGVWQQYVSVKVRRWMDVVWMLCDAIKGSSFWVISRLGIGLTIEIIGREGMFWIVSRYFLRHFHDWKFSEVFS